jgi:SAM-dependent methyltransferase
MNASGTSGGFEYENKGNETPFETFLRYTDEKEKSSTQLATILQDLLNDQSNILDIGTGNGEYLHLTLSKIKDLQKYNLTLLEPSNDLSAQLTSRFDDIVGKKQIHVTTSTLTNFDTDDKFDAILASHLFYHLPRHDWAADLSRIVSLLKPGGALIIVLREKDDAYAFKTRFKPLLFSNFTRALLLDDVLESLPGDVEIKKYIAASNLNIPYKDNKSDTISIIEFYLNKKWHDIPLPIQKNVLDFIDAHQGMFKQLDGIAVVKKM